MRPTQSRAARALTKEGAKRILGFGSGWQAHKAKGCLTDCFYCCIQRTLGDAVDRHGRPRSLADRAFIARVKQERRLVHG